MIVPIQSPREAAIMHALFDLEAAARAEGRQTESMKHHTFCEYEVEKLEALIQARRLAHIAAAKAAGVNREWTLTVK